MRSQTTSMRQISFMLKTEKQPAHSTIYRDSYLGYLYGPLIVFHTCLRIPVMWLASLGAFELAGVWHGRVRLTI